MDMDHMQHDTDGGQDRAARRKELKHAFHKAATAYFKAISHNSRDTMDKRLAAADAYKAWKNAH